MLVVGVGVEGTVGMVALVRVEVEVEVMVVTVEEEVAGGVEGVIERMVTGVVVLGEVVVVVVVVLWT